MTNYVKSTNFASKDSLATGNPLKIVKGTEIDTEFNNIATAIATKADLNSPTFIGSPTAPTPASGNSTTLLATTAFVTSAITTAVAAAVASTKTSLFPVGSIYTNATDNTNPASLLGFGTWVSFGAGRVPVGFDNTNTLFNAAEKTGGSYDAAVVSHSHTVTASGTTGAAGSHSHSINDPGHAHSTSGGVAPGTGGFTKADSASSAAPNTDSSTTGISINSVGDHTHSLSVSGSTSTVGSSATNANVQPYITVYMWKRTA